MKLDRLMGILTLLLQRDKVTAPELAERFEVSRRTINRDIEALCQAGIPLITTQGQGGGIALADGYKLDHTLLKPAELQAIVTGLKGLDSVTRDSASPALLEKLRLSSDSWTHDAIIIDLSSHYQDSLSPKIQLIREAITAHRLLCFTYYTAQSESVRCIEPYHLIFQWTDWYVLGYCLKREDYRLFKLNRLWEARLSPAGFTPRAVPPEALRLGDYLTQLPWRFEGLFDPSARWRLIEEYGPQSFTTEPDGRLLFCWDFGSLDYLLQWVLSFGSLVTVLAPAELVHLLASEVQKMQQQLGQT